MSDGDPLEDSGAFAADAGAAGPVAVEDLTAAVADLEEETDSEDATEEVQELTDLLAAAHERGLIESNVRHLGITDAVEALVGSVVFAAPLLVEDGVFDIADHLARSTLFGLPVFLAANTLFVVFLTYALMEWTGRDTSEERDLLGVVPARLVMTLLVSFVVAAAMMTVWGRVGDWQPPGEALARVNVVWTVGAIGAALGDLISTGDRSGSTTAGAGRAGESGANARAAATTSIEDAALVAAIQDGFERLESALEDGDERREVRRLRERATDAALEDTFGQEIRKYTGRDVAEAFVGSVVFSIPFLVEDGVFDVAEYFLSFRIGLFPIFFLVNAAFVLAMVATLVFWAGPQDVRMTRPLFGIVPRRLVGISLVSFLTTAALMTMWGRVGGWAEPTVAVARISVVWTVASFGASLGDVLPGESSGDDINDDLADLGAQVGLAEEAE